MNAKKALDEGLSRIDPVGEEKLDRLERANPPQALLEEVLDSDPQSASPAAGGGAGGPGGVWRRRGPRLALGAGIALAALATALIVSGGGDNTSQAFAVEPQDGGGVTIKVHSLEEAAGLEKALADAGIRSQVSWLPAGTTCREPHYTPSRVKTALGGSLGGISGGGPGEAWTIGVMTTEQYRAQRQRYMHGEISADEFYEATGNITLDPAEFRPDQSVVLSGTPVPYDGDPEGGSIASLGVAEGPVQPCKPVPALPSGSGAPFGLTPAGGPAYAPRGDAALSQAAIAADLRQTAAVAEASDSQLEAPPGPGQFLYAKTKMTQLEGWLPKGHGKGSKAHPRYFVPISDPTARYALVPTLKEVWTAPDGTTREREALGQVHFLSGADQSRWEEAGSPPPFEYDPAEHHVGHDGSGRPLKEYAAKTFRGRHEFTYMSRLSELPTESEALRVAVENRRGASPPVEPSPAASQRGGGTVERLLAILSEPIARPALRAAAFNALAEIPGIGFERDVVDGAGRRGDAIGWVRDMGFGRRYIFDPHTAEILSEAEVLFNAKAAEHPGVPDGTVFRETAYLRSGIVDSNRVRPGT